MKWNLILGLAGSSVLSSLLIGLSSESASASFTCGPHLSTYRVQSLGNAVGQGVRCVKFNVPAQSGYFMWYGEGNWGGRTYRHVGEGSLNGRASAADIFGNGEYAGGRFDNNLRITASGGGIPRIIQVTGAWGERWILEDDNVVQDYTSRLGAVGTCGPHFDEFTVRDANNRRSGKGIRCVGLSGSVWYGEGNWGNITYAHLGWGVNSSSPTGAFDICEPSKFATCGVFDRGSLTKNRLPGQPYPACAKISGAWNEILRQQSSWETVIAYGKGSQLQRLTPPQQYCP